MNEEKAIKALKEMKEQVSTSYYQNHYSNIDSAIETVLSMLKEKDNEIYQLKIAYKLMEREAMRDGKAELKKKDKIIDFMSYAMTHEEIPQDEYCIFRDMNCELVGGSKECKDCIKQYFERKVENGN